jgi:hypothetical protein
VEFDEKLKANREAKAKKAAEPGQKSTEAAPKAVVEVSIPAKVAKKARIISKPTVESDAEDDDEMVREAEEAERKAKELRKAAEEKKKVKEARKKEEERRKKEEEKKEEERKKKEEARKRQEEKKKEAARIKRVSDTRKVEGQIEKEKGKKKAMQLPEKGNETETVVVRRVASGSRSEAGPAGEADSSDDDLSICKSCQKSGNADECIVPSKGKAKSCGRCKRLKLRCSFASSGSGSGDSGIFQLF